MARFSSEDIERVRAASDLAAIAGQSLILKPSGRKLKACCPFHQEKTPSFQIDPVLGTWHCFGCGEHGDVFEFVCRMENIEFPEAVRLLADKAGIELEMDKNSGQYAPKGHKERLKDVCDAACAYYHHELMRSPDPGAAAARSYLASRGFGSAVCKRWQLGYAPGKGKLVAHLKQCGFSQNEIIDANLAYSYDNVSGRAPIKDRFYERVMFPIKDRSGRCVAFGGRVIGKGEPKYLNSSETLIFHKSSNLFAIDRARNPITNNARAVVVEGYTDVIAMHEAGIDYVVATLGTALTQQHVRLLRSLRPKEIIYLFDGDSAGQKAADRAVEFIDQSVTQEAGSAFIDFKVVILPDNQDPMEFCASKGKEAMLKALDNAEPLIRFAIDRRLAAWNLNAPEQRNLALKAAVELLAPIKDSLIAQDYAYYIADRLSLNGRSCDADTVKLALRKAEVKRGGDSVVQSITPLPVYEESLTQSAKYQRELLTLAVRYRELRESLKDEYIAFDWDEGMPLSIASFLFDSSADGLDPVMFSSDDPAALLSRLDSRVPASARYLSLSSLDPENAAQAMQSAKEMFHALRIQLLEEKIRMGNQRLRNADKMSEEEYDDLFREISALQRDLKELRFGADKNRMKGAL